MVTMRAEIDERIIIDEATEIDEMMWREYYNITTPTIKITNWRERLENAK